VKEPSPYSIQRVYAESVPQPWGPPPELMADERAPDLRDYMRIIRRHLKLIATVIGGALLVTVLAVLSMTPIYTAHSTILVEEHAPQVLDMHDLLADQADSDEHDYFKTQERILQSRSLAAQVIRELGLESNPLFSPDAREKGFVGGLLSKVRSLFTATTTRTASRTSSETLGVSADLIDLYNDRLAIKPELGTRLFTVAFSIPDPALAAQITNAHVNAYIRRGMELHAQASEDAREFLEKKLVELKERVEKSEAALNDYRRERGIVAFALDNQGNILNQRLTELDQALTKAETEGIDLEAQDDLVHKRNYNSLPAVINSTLIQNLKEQDELAEGQYASMSAQFKPDYPPLKELKAKVDEIRERLRGEIRHVVEGIESNYQTAVARENELSKQVELEKTKTLALNDASLQDAVLAREVDASRQLYKSVLERMKEIGVAGEVTTSNVSIVDDASAPTRPSSPRPLLDLLLAGVASLFCGVGLAFLLDHLDDSLHNPEEAEMYLGLASLGSVPDFVLLDDDADGADDRLLSKTTPMIPDFSGAEGKEIVLIHGDRLSVAGESYRAIRTAILLSRASEPPRTIMFASSLKAEGKTITAVNIAMTFAQMGGRVLLIDGDLRRARCHEVLGVHNRDGLTEVLVGQKQLADVIRTIGSSSGISILSAGAAPPNPTELLASERMRDVMAELRAQYDIVLIDAPPVMPVSDSVVLSRIVDGVVMVIGPGTPKQLVRHACGRLEQVGAKLLGLVLNQVNLKSPDFYHYNRYYAYEDYYQPNGRVSQR
jgi:polysaccharide biosynthesis transport protein